MKIISKLSGLSLLSLVLVLSTPFAAFAATTPSLAAASTYGVLSSTYTDTSGATTINGDVGFTTPPATAPGGVHTNYGSGAPYATAGIDQGSALNPGLSSQPCTFTFANGAIDLATDVTHGPIGVYTPGVYCTGTGGAASIGAGGITLSGSGTYIFRINGALTSVANSNVTAANGASPCDVFWTPTGLTTLGANSTFLGTNIDASGITVGSTVAWIGRALAFGGTVTTNTDTISTPSCTVAPTNGGGGPLLLPNPGGGPVRFFSPFTATTTVATTTPVVTPVVRPATTTPASATSTTTTTVTTTTVPHLPNTGLPPEQNDAPSSIAALAGMLALASILGVFALKKQAN